MLVYSFSRKHKGNNITPQGLGIAAGTTLLTNTVIDKTSFQEDVVLQYDETKEHVQNPVYTLELALR